MDTIRTEALLGMAAYLERLDRDKYQMVDIEVKNGKLKLIHRSSTIENPSEFSSQREVLVDGYGNISILSEIKL